jgi:hypothetical protein
MQFDRELLKGSIALLILKLLSERDMYGYEIIQESVRRSREREAETNLDSRSGGQDRAEGDGGSTERNL